jgi:hypothetical protein
MAWARIPALESIKLGRGGDTVLAEFRACTVFGTWPEYQYNPDHN